MDIIPQNTLMKQCANCKKFFPATPEYFCRRARVKSGLRGQCKECTQSASKIYQSQPEVQKRMQSYHQVWGKEYNSRPEVQAHNQEYGNDYRKRPEVQQREQARSIVYDSNPERQEKDKIIRQIYYSRPEVKERYRIHSLHRRGVKKMAKGTHTLADIQAQYERQKGKCYYVACGHCELGKTYHVDHVVPLSREGSNDISNLVISCPTCNQKKNNKMPHEWFEGGRLM